MENIIEDCHSFRKDISDLENMKADRKDLSEQKTKIGDMLQAKVDLNEVQGVLNSFQSEVANRLFDMKRSLQKEISTSQEYLNHQIMKKASIEDLHETVSSKVD